MWCPPPPPLQYSLNFSAQTLPNNNNITHLIAILSTNLSTSVVLFSWEDSYMIISSTFSATFLITDLKRGKQENEIVLRKWTQTKAVWATHPISQFPDEPSRTYCEVQWKHTVKYNGTIKSEPPSFKLLLIKLFSHNTENLLVKCSLSWGAAKKFFRTRLQSS